MRPTPRGLLVLALVALPVAVAALPLSVPGAVAATAALVAAIWLLTLGRTLRPPAGPDLVLETISASHYVEKVRWSMDRLGVGYVEVPCAGILGVFFTGRSVPRLVARTGSVDSSIGNSAEILRYLWGRYGEELGDRAAFLRPTPDAVALEARLDRHGRDLQRWVYFHLLDHPAECLRAWGAEDRRLPAWQRTLLRLLFPVLRAFLRRAFALRPSAGPRIVERIEETLAHLEDLLGDGRSTLLGGEVSYVDLHAASMAGLWLLPAAYGGGEADPVRPDPERLPPAMQAERARWMDRFPRLVTHVERLYATARAPSAVAPRTC